MPALASKRPTDLVRPKVAVPATIRLARTRGVPTVTLPLTARRARGGQRGGSGRWWFGWRGSGGTRPQAPPHGVHGPLGSSARSTSASPALTLDGAGGHKGLRGDAAGDQALGDHPSGHCGQGRGRGPSAACTAVANGRPVRQLPGSRTTHRRPLTNAAVGVQHAGGHRLAQRGGARHIEVALVQRAANVDVAVDCAHSGGGGAAGSFRHSCARM